MFCKYCGNKLLYDTQTFCTVCGKQLDAPSVALPQKKRIDIGKVVIALLKCAGYYAIFFTVQLLLELIYQGVLSGVLAERGVVLFDNNGFQGLSAEFWAEYSKYSSIVMIVSAALSVLIMALISGRGKRGFFRETHFHKTSPSTFLINYVFGLGLQIISIIVISYAAAMLEGVADSLTQTDDTMSYMFGGGSKVLMFLGIAVATPIVEEVLFRGLIYTRLKKALPRWPSIIISAVIFGIAHGNIAQFIYAGALGVVLAIVYDKYNSLWAPILLHAGFNSVSVLTEQINFENPLAEPALIITGIGLFLVGLLFVFVAKPVYKEENIGEQTNELKAI